MGAPEVTRELLVGLSTLVVPDKHDLVGADPSEAGHDRRVIAVASVSTKLTEVLADHVDVVAGLGTLWMTRDAHSIPWRQ